MEQELILKYGYELRNTLPIEFDGIQLYPVLYKDYEAYEMFSHALTYNPIYFQDVELSSLPRLYFITSILKEDQETLHPLRKVFFSELCGILQLVLHEQEFGFEPIPSGQFALCIYTDASRTTKTIINAKKFEDMRKIILLQNDTFYEDEYIHPDILRWIEEQKQLERKYSSKDIIETTEDRIEALMITLCQADESFVNKMSIRRVNRLHSKVLDRDVYKAQLNGAMGGMVKFKENPVSWTVTKPKQTDFDKYLKELRTY